jgi:hypothetical protein
VPAKRRREHLPLARSHGRRRAQTDPGEWPLPGWSGQELDLGPVPERAHREPQSVQRRAQLMSISRPSGSTLSRRLSSARSSIALPPTVKRHGCVLCSDGARRATPAR